MQNVQYKQDAGDLDWKVIFLLGIILRTKVLEKNYVLHQGFPIFYDSWLIMKTVQFR